MTEELKKALDVILSHYSPQDPDYPYLEKCYRALSVININPEEDLLLVSWAEDFPTDGNVLEMMLQYWNRNREHFGSASAPVVALEFVQGFYYDRKKFFLELCAEDDYYDYMNSLRGKDFHDIIGAAHELDMKKQIMKFLLSNDERCKLDIEDIDILLTLKHPVAQLYEACKAQDAIREAVECSLDRVTQQQKSYLQTAPDTADEDVQIYRARYLSDREEVPFPVVSQMCEQLIARAEQELAAAIDGPPLPPEHVVRLHDTITFFREQGYTPTEAVVMLTYDHPFAEVLNRMEQGGLQVEFAFHCAAADRQAEMQQYIERLGSLPATLQKSVREYQERLAAVEVFCAGAPEDGQGQEWETEER